MKTLLTNKSVAKKSVKKFRHADFNKTNETKSNDMKIVMKRIDDLESVAWNPQIRIAERKISKLRESIAQNGLMNPILIDKENNVIDGTRRWTACKELGYEMIPCVISNGQLSAAKKFELLNSSSMSITPSQLMEIVAGGGTVPEKFNKAISEIIELVGREKFQEIAKMNIPPTSLLNMGKYVATYLHNAQNREYIAKVIYWLAKNKQLILAKKAVDISYRASKIKEAIEENKPLDLVSIMAEWNKRYQIIGRVRMKKMINTIKARQPKLEDRLALDSVCIAGDSRN